MTLCISQSDVKQAYDHTEHVDIGITMCDQGASAARILPLLNEYEDIKAYAYIPNVAETGGIPFTKALRTGGKDSQHVFNSAVSWIMSKVMEIWDLAGCGFELPDTGEMLTNIWYVDGIVMFAKSQQE